MQSNQFCLGKITLIVFKRSEFLTTIDQATMIKKHTIVYSVAFLILSSILAVGLYVERENQFLQQSEAAAANEKNRKNNPHFSQKWTESQLAENGIEVRKAGPGLLKVCVSCSGNIIVHPDHMAHIVPKVSGIAKEIRKNLGDQVRENEVMVVLDSREIAAAKADYFTAYTNERLSKAAFERELRLYKKGISPENDYLLAQSNYEKIKIDLQSFKQKLQTYGLSEEEIYSLIFANQSDLRNYEIRSPIEGTVIKRHIISGEFIPDSNTIFEIANLRKVWVEMSIYPQDLMSIKERQNVEIIAPIENQSGYGRLVYISPIIDDETLMIKAIAELDNLNGEWRVGTFVNVKIATDQVSVPVMVPRGALRKKNGEDHLYVLSQWGMERRSVRLGRSNQNYVEILSGLNPGEKYLLIPFIKT
jgi:cobalt-zinc-cadmium efflux system membrane fusion protein